MTRGPADGTASPRRRVLARHAPAAVAFLVLAAVTVGVSLALHGLVRSQERRLLSERAAEVTAFLTTSVNDVRAALFAAGSVAATDPGASPLFSKLTASLTAGGGTVVVAREDGGALTPIAVAGRPIAPGPVTGPVADLALRTVGPGGADLVSGLVTDGGIRRSVVAARIDPAAGVVAYVSSAVTTSPAQPTEDSPYRELDVAVYAGTTPDPARLALASGSVPSAAHGDTVSRPLPVGADTWLIVLAARQPLVGSVATAFPWFVLAGGLLVAGLMAALIEALTRRRAYALGLVEQRTRALAQAQAEAEAANRSKSEFLSRMSHELRTPLNAVLGFGQLLELDDLTDDQRQSVNQITRGGRHLLDLINEVLDITRIENGQLSLSPEAVLVSDLVGDAVDLVRPLAQERSIHLLNGDGAGCLQYVFADRQRLKQILLNLLGNAIKYNRHGGSVAIGCGHVENGRLRIEVTDTGPGIPRERFHLLFTPFERLGAEQSTVEGTGIGLALSRRLAEAMGGTLGVESTVGRGSTFWVEFPVVEGPLDRYVRLGSPAAGSAPPADDGPCILHIEDNLANIALMERVIAQRPGIGLIPAMQGRLGLELARQHLPVLILLDLNLADLPGEEVLEQLRDDPTTAAIPVVVISADAMPRQVQRLLSAGASAYLTKPFDVRDLLALVDRALAERDAREPVTAQPDGTGE